MAADRIAEELRELARQELRKRRQDLEDESHRLTGRSEKTEWEQTIPLSVETARELNRKEAALNRAEQRIEQYSPKPGNEHCPVCDAFDEIEVSLERTYIGPPAAPTDIAFRCETCRSSKIVRLFLT